VATKVDERPVGRLGRWGLALVAPRWALAIGDDPRQPGRAGSDLVALFGALLVALHLRALVAAGWLTAEFGLGVGGRAMAMVLSRAFTADLAFLVIGAGVVFALGGARRALGRAFDLACVAAVPLIVVEAVAIGVGQLIAPPAPLGLIATGIGYAWSGSLLALALIQMRRAPRGVLVAPGIAARGTWAGRGVAAGLALGLVLGGAWIGQHLDQLRPLSEGDAPPSVPLPAITADGSLGPPITLGALRGQVVLVDLWATWCQPCRAAMPGLVALGQRDAGRGLRVVAINLDDPVAAAKMFADAHWDVPLYWGSAEVSERFGVSTIPHAVVIDRAGVVRGVFRGDPAGAEALAERLLAE
jgi:thiol-disulfide isomerase/thioredoxin